jgi:hypothetical protein
LSFGSPSALRQKLHIDNMLLLARLEGKPKSGPIFVYLFISVTLIPFNSVAQSIENALIVPRQYIVPIEQYAHATFHQSVLSGRFFG